MKPTDQHIATAYQELTDVLFEFKKKDIDPTDWEYMDKIITASNKVQENLKAQQGYDSGKFD